MKLRRSVFGGYIPRRIVEPPPQALLHLSGGQDSTTSLYLHAVRTPEVRLLIHHVKLRHMAEDRLNAEEEAVRRVLRWVREKTGFTNYIFKESTFDYGDLPRISIKDIQVVALFSGIILRTPAWRSIDKLILSWHKGEVNQKEINRGIRVRAMLKALDVGREIELTFPLEHMDRRQMADMVPHDLLALCHCCRKPRNHTPCGTCKTCLELKEAGIYEVVGSTYTSVRTK